MVKETAPGAVRMPSFQREVRRRPGANLRILIPAAKAEVRRGASAALHQSDPRGVADSTIPRSGAPGAVRMPAFLREVRRRPGAKDRWDQGENAKPWADPVHWDEPAGPDV